MHSQYHKYFSQTYRQCLDIWQKKLDNISMTILSMGMSGDYQTAMKHGSTMIRVGTRIFGKRNY